jgi:hypothetical protein
MSRVASWGLNAPFAIAHLSQLPLVASETSPLHSIKSVMAFIASPIQFVKDAHELSPTLKERATNQRDIAGNIPIFTDVKAGLSSAFLSIVKKGFWDPLDAIAFHAAYTQHMQKSGNNTGEALNIANRVVEKVAGSNAQKDIPNLKRHSWTQLLSQRMSFDLANYNAIVTNFKRMRTGDPGDIAIASGKILVRTVVQGALFAALYGAVKGLATGGGMSEDIKKELGDFSTPGAAAKSIALMAAASFVRTIPLVRDVLGAAFQSHQQGITGTSPLTTPAKAIHDLFWAKDPRIARDIMDMASDFVPMPTTQWFRTVDGLRHAHDQGGGIVRYMLGAIGGAPPEHRH